MKLYACAGIRAKKNCRYMWRHRSRSTYMQPKGCTCSCTGFFFFFFVHGEFRYKWKGPGSLLTSVMLQLSTSNSTRK